MKKVILLLSVTIIAITGCSKSSGVMEYSPDLYSVSVDVDSEFYGLASAKKKAFDEARVFCTSKGKILSIESTEGVSNSFGYTTATVIFRCVEE